jgi:tetratricopeptide (TPR) repeat protein
MAEALTLSTSVAGEHFSESGRVAPRPQPVGLFPLPLGYMLIPAGEDTNAAREELLAGRLPESWPPSLRAHELAAAGERDAAIAELQNRIDPVATYNRFVLDPDSVDPEKLRRELGEFAILVDVVLFTLGRIDTPPHSDSADGEIAAALLSAEAGHALVEADVQTAIELLDRAAQAAAPVSSPLAGTLLGAAGGICRDIGDAGSVTRLQQSLSELDGADGLRVAHAEIHLCLAGVLHEQAEQRPELLTTAIPHYHSALQLVRRSDAPMLWAAAHAGLAAAYLTMPMVEASSQLRLGVAAQSLRSALTVYTRTEHPQEWASVQLNLANSLVYTPSRHHRENLVEAVEVYEAVLQTRDRASDPLGRARVLANQGNVLAHLGVFDSAKAKLYEARFLFEELGEDDSVRAVRGVLDEIARQRVLSNTDESGRP